MSNVTIDSKKNANAQVSLIEPVNSFNLQIAAEKFSHISHVHKFGRNPNIPNNPGTFEAIWNGGGDYTGHNCTAAETLEVFSSSGEDAGTLLSSGTVTGGSTTTLQDTSATFSSDGVVAGDVVLDDTQSIHAIVTAVTETQLTFLTMQNTLSGTPVIGDAYRIVTSGGSGTPAIELKFLLDGNFEQVQNEYIILNGATKVSTVGTYIRQTRAICIGSINAGVITCRQKTTTANIMMVMAVGVGSTMVAAFTVPAGKHGYIQSWHASLSAKTNSNCNVRLMIKETGCCYRIHEDQSVMGAGSSWFLRTYQIPKSAALFPATDIKIMADSDTAATGIAGGFDIILVDI